MNGGDTVFWRGKDLILSLGESKAVLTRGGYPGPVLEVSVDPYFGESESFFDLEAKADLLPKAHETLKQAAKAIRENARGMVAIEGHTDSIGCPVSHFQYRGNRG